MLNITFEFVGGPNDGKVLQGKLGEPSDAERHYLFSDRGRVGQRFAVASDYALEVLANAESEKGPSVQRHHYIVTDRQEQGEEVWVQAEYAPEKAGPTLHRPEQEEVRLPRKLAGQLLIASPSMDDPAFGQSVILVLEQSEDETVGVVLNHPTPETVSQLWKEVSEIPCDNSHPVYLGGPEDGPVVVLHTDESAADVPVIPGVFLSLDKDSLEWVVHQDEIFHRLLLGAASWDAEQLEEEFANGDWLVLPATKDLVFADPDVQWRDAMRQFECAFFRSIGVKHIPDDPRAN